MAAEQEFKGDVGQNVFGNVNEALRLQNVVNLNIAKDAPEVQTITDFQRERISTLVKDLVSITGDHTLDVYRIILTDFGIEKIRQLPRERYKEVVATLDKWIVDAKDATRNASEKPDVEKLEIEMHSPATCLGCIEKSASYSRLQRSSRGQLAALVFCLGGCGWLLYKMPTTTEAAPITVTSRENRCYLDGKIYSAGITVQTAAGLMQECLPATDQTSAMWGNNRRGRLLP
ncbi:MAG: hypothetical protein NVSMB6_15250 [Burkholderiaceae bacterium]